MLLSDVLARLAVLPDPLPPAPTALDARVLASVDRLPGWVQRRGEPATRDAAALVLLYPDAAGEAWLVLTERPPGSHRHAGQIALPGGKRDPGDDFPVGTALREAAEEVGLDVVAEDVRVLGRLEPVDVRVSGFMLVPVLATVDRRPTLHADGHEVASIIHAPVRAFLPSAPIEVVEEERDGWRVRYGAFPIDGHRVWGATGKVLGQLGAILGG